PDITCIDKVIGGSRPVGTYGGKRNIIEYIAPAGSIYQAGTISGNPLAMTAGYETLSQIKQSDYENMNKKIDLLIEGYKSAASKYDIALQIDLAGSMIVFFFTSEE